ncbi:hypothetical protein [Desulfopila aestuarii]|uniref:Hemolysin III n=1 Tax=Desulfopila aestuarii DSM 18488 TaxID=1121416 RepID=A0A1M7Y646_9BACT|nr:hypothetical protein [Desulfopila aestuarii]SHO48123.1 hypothetical protein SAMN02745220_02141 [Desulfopila aestuarii DSM 18488]
MRKIVLFRFSRLKSIEYSDQELTPENWCEKQPCMRVNIASREIILTQPTSTFFVYLLGVLTTGIGIYFLLIRGSELSRLWWGISLILWGIGALLAGTSYQAFAFEIKCRGRSKCSWTSWWEVVYLMLQQVSVNAMLVAVAYSCTSGRVLNILLGYALLSSVVYCLMILVGALVPIKSWLTFNVMVWVSVPVYLLTVLINGSRYYMFGSQMDLVLLGTWALLLLTSIMYCMYDNLGLTEKLWARGKGLWFSQNDVLHVGLILWVIYIGIAVAHQITDYSVPV